MEPAMSDEELREYDAERALDYQEAQAWKRAQDQIAALTAQRDEARAEVRRLTAALATVTTERDGLWTRLGAHEGALYDTIARLRDEKAGLRTQVDVLGDTAHRIADAWNQIAGHFLVSPSPANAERIARLACAAAEVRDEAIRTRDEAVAELQRLRAEHAATLATARREGAHAAAVEVARGLGAIIGGSRSPPTDAEIEAHAKVGGRWLIIEGADFGSYQLNSPSARYLYAPTATRWIPCGADGRPCEWPTAEQAGSVRDAIRALPLDAPGGAT